MNRVRLCICFALLSLWACSSEDDNIPTSFTNGPPLWIEDFPKVAVGAVSVDLTLKTDRGCNVHYVIATEDLELSSKEVMEKSELLETGPIYAAGVINVSDVEGVRETIEVLEDRHYYAYLVAQNLGDTLYLDEPEIREFTTSSRQDTLQYFSAVENRNVNYLIYRPEEVLKYPDTAYPACFFLASESEVSSSGEINLIRNGTLVETIELGLDVPCLVISPQHVNEAWSLDFLQEFMTYAKANYAIQPDMVYMTGIGSGGFATWEYAKQHPAEIAAIVPLSADASDESVCNLSDVAVWAFHNETDYAVSSDNVVSAIQSLDGCPPEREVKSLLFPDPGHDCWKRVYNYNHPDWSKSPGVAKVDIFEWLLSITK
jgi:predicted peptidase